MKVGFIGLGYLGKTMAERLISEGTQLVVWNRTGNKASGLAAEIALTPAGLAEETEVIFLNLFDSDAVKTIFAGETGLLAGDVKGKIVVDTTTNHFKEVSSFYAALSDRGGCYLEAPVLGSVVPASQGNLTVLVSGDKDAFERVRPEIEKIGKTIFFLEQPGLATKMKLINNLLLGAFMAAIAEATVLGEASGVKKETVLDIFAAGAGNSAVLNAKRQKLLAGDFSTHFSSALIHKDLHYLQDLARTLKRPLFTGTVAKELFGLTFKDGKEGLDFSALYEVLKGL
jgi:3-hydroxyisobutyrate dehydrogenase